MKSKICIFALTFLFLGCSPVPEVVPPTIPAIEYSKQLHLNYHKGNKEIEMIKQEYQNRGDNLILSKNVSRASIKFVKDIPPEERKLNKQRENLSALPYLNSNNKSKEESNLDNVYMERSRRASLGYRGPLQLGQPGVTSSLWHENAQNNIFRDHRAFAPMDVITIVVSENSEGKREAETNVKQESDVALGIANLLNFERDIEGRNTGLDSSNLVNASSQNDFKGKGKVTRKGSLKGTISAMVVEVLPSGIMRVEGEKIVAVNGEEQIMVLSGLVRPQDVSSSNEVLSSKVANLRIDYFGKGTIGESQRGGWLGRFLRKVWPF